MSTISPTQKHDRDLIISAVLTAIPLGLIIWYLGDDLAVKHGNLVLTLVAASAVIAALHIIYARLRDEFREALTLVRALRITQLDENGADNYDDSNVVHLHRRE